MSSLGVRLLPQLLLLSLEARRGRSGDAKASLEVSGTAADLWSAGAVVYEMLTGRVAFAPVWDSDYTVSALCETSPACFARSKDGCVSLSWALQDLSISQGSHTCLNQDD